MNCIRHLHMRQNCIEFRPQTAESEMVKTFLTLAAFAVVCCVHVSLSQQRKQSENEPSTPPTTFTCLQISCNESGKVNIRVTLTIGSREQSVQLQTHIVYPNLRLSLWDLVGNFQSQIGKSIHASFTDKEVIYIQQWRLGQIGIN